MRSLGRSRSGSGFQPRISNSLTSISSNGPFQPKQQIPAPGLWWAAKASVAPGFRAATACSRQFHGSRMSRNRASAFVAACRWKHPCNAVPHFHQPGPSRGCAAQGALNSSRASWLTFAIRPRKPGKRDCKRAGTTAGFQDCPCLANAKAHADMGWRPGINYLCSGRFRPISLSKGCLFAANRRAATG